MRKQSNGDSTTYYYAYTDADNTMKALKPEETTTPVFSSVKFINMTEGELEGKDISINVISRGIQTEDGRTDGSVRHARSDRRKVLK